MNFSYYTRVGYSSGIDMGHTVRDKIKLLARVRRIRGQVEALERALETEKGCNEVLQQIVAVRGAMNGLMSEVIEEHVRTHIASPAITSDAERARGADELIEVVRSYLK
jgi:DNA-binding FrmR family transcriptional regulator